MVARGRHDIPEEKIRGRYDRSRINLIGLMPLTELRVFRQQLLTRSAGRPRSAAGPHSSPRERENRGDGRLGRNASVGQGSSSIDTRIVLIDGVELAKLMIAHGVGVTPVAVYELKRVDSDYFTQE